jgi:hypothetical protein
MKVDLGQSLFAPHIALIWAYGMQFEKKANETSKNEALWTRFMSRPSKTTTKRGGVELNARRYGAPKAEHQIAGVLRGFRGFR